MLAISFPADQVLEWCERSQKKLWRFATEFIQDLNQHVVENTPFLTGNLRGHWYAGLNGEPDARDGAPDPGGGAVARMNLAAVDLKLGDVYYAVNGASYAGYLEFGTSRMWPRYFVRTTVNLAPVYAEATIQRLASED